MIYDCQHRVMRSVGRQSSNEVQGYLLEWERIIWCGDAVQRRAFAMGDVLVLLAHCASCNVICNPRPHPGPPIYVGDLSESLVSARMPCGRCIVSHLKDFVLELLVW